MRLAAGFRDFGIGLWKLVVKIKEEQINVGMNVDMLSNAGRAK